MKKYETFNLTLGQVLFYMWHGCFEFEFDGKADKEVRELAEKLTTEIDNMYPDLAFHGKDVGDRDVQKLLDIRLKDLIKSYKKSHPKIKRPKKVYTIRHHWHCKDCAEDYAKGDYDLFLQKKERLRAKKEARK